MNEIGENFDSILHRKSQNLVKISNNFEERLRTAADFVGRFNNCEQQRVDVATEISFLKLMIDVIFEACDRTFDENGNKLLNHAFELANKFGPATECSKKEFQEHVREAHKHSSDPPVSFKEKTMILKAMDLSRGHWYKCSNGHIYAIGDCGGAMEESKCPECGAAIGGTDHRLVDGNAVASEMDGATQPAWPQPQPQLQMEVVGLTLKV